MQYPKITERHDLAKSVRVGDTLAKRSYIVGTRGGSVDLVIVDEIDGLVVVSGGKRYVLTDSDSPHSGWSWRKATKEDFDAKEASIRKILVDKIEGTDWGTVETSTLKKIAKLLRS